MLTALFIAHFLADFTLQPEHLARAKRKQQRALLLHSGIYGIVLSATCFFCAKAACAIVPSLVLMLSHLLIDEVKCVLERRVLQDKGDFWIFLIDQALHLISIVLTWRLFRLEEVPGWLWMRANGWRYFPEAMTYGLIFVILWDPACVFVRKLFDALSGETAQADFSQEPKTGRIIGKLERLILAVLVLSGQLGGIGFVLTAKSLARFKQFEQQGFAERYLVGTLASTAMAIIITLALRAMLLNG